MDRQEALKEAHELFEYHLGFLKLPSLSKFTFESMTYGLAKHSRNGITFNADFYVDINSANVDLFLGSMIHEILHYNRQDLFWDRIFDRIPAHWNEGHQALDDIAQNKGVALYPLFKLKTGCCSN